MLPLNKLRSTKVKIKKEVIVTQRRTILILLPLLIATTSTLTFKIIDDNLKQKQAGDIITCANQKAEQIISNAQNDADIIKYSTALEANKKADAIKQTAEDKANKIIDNAINTKIDEVETLAAIVHVESGDQPIKGRAAVASTIRNRINNPEFGNPNSVKEVVYQKNQFDPVTNGMDLSKVVPDKDTFEGVKLALEGNDYSNGATYFLDPKISTPRNIAWFNSALQTTAVIGDHVFKKDKKH